MDYEILTQLNDSLHVNLAALLEQINSGTGAVDSSVIAESDALQAANKEYINYVREQASLMVTGLTDLKAAIDSGDLTKSQEAYTISRNPYERIEPIIEKFPQLDGSMDARVDDYTNETDPAFTGYHRIEYLLFVDKNTKDAVAIADRLLADSLKMKESFESTVIEPVDFVTGVGELMEEAQATKITGEEERWSGATVPVIRGNVEGAEKIFVLVKEELKKKDAALASTIEERLKDVFAALDALSPVGPTWAAYDQIKQEDKVQLKNKLEALAEPMATMPGILGGK